MNHIRRNVKTHAHRDYSNNGVPSIISTTEAQAEESRWADALSLGRISQADMDYVTDLIRKHTVPSA